MTLFNHKSLYTYRQDRSTYRSQINLVSLTTRLAPLLINNDVQQLAHNPGDSAYNCHCVAMTMTRCA